MVVLTRLFTLSIFAAVGCLLAAPALGATVVVQDDFNDNSLDTSTWEVAIPSGHPTANATEQNQRMEIYSRAHLRTVDQWDPLWHGGLHITGEWTFDPANSYAMMQILTRSEGTPTSGYGETSQGIEFFAQSNDNAMKIQSRGGAPVSGASATVDMNLGETFAFDIVDTGYDLSFTMSEIGGDGTTATLHGTSDYTYATNKVVFHNREGTRTDYLDNVQVETLDYYPATQPPPGWHTLVADDFNDNRFDTSKWEVLAPPNYSGATATEQNHRLELFSRAHLRTIDEIDPTDHPLRIAGLWQVESGGDFLQILTRSNGEPGGGSGETETGIEFFASAVSDNMRIRGRGLSVSDEDFVDVSIGGGDLFFFEIYDYGDELSFLLSEIGGDGTTAMVTASATQAMLDNHVVFHNREGSHTAFLDSVTISTIPEPSSVVLILLGLAGLLLRRRRR
jgi:hypothetical protein